MAGRTARVRVGIGALLVSIASGAPAQEQTFAGIIIDETCARGGHAAMRMGPTDADCAQLCVMLHDSAYVLLSGETVYALSNQRLPEPFAAQEVVVTGSLDAETQTIRVVAIKAAK